MNFSTLNLQAKAYVFEYDNVLFPQKDYDLQVYYLFCQFIEYLHPDIDSKLILQQISERYKDFENKEMYEFIKSSFNLEKDYSENLMLLCDSAQLPLKLLLYKESLAILNKLHALNKQLFILTSGKPQIQLNKIKQTDWHGFDKLLKVYFTDEFALKPNPLSLNQLMLENNLKSNELIFIGTNKLDELFANEAKVMYYGLSFIY